MPSLPVESSQDSAAGTKLYFDAYGKEPLEFQANDVSASIGFFQSRGFDNDAAISTAAVLLKQAKLDGVPIFKVLDTLKSFTGIQISTLVAEILNNNRPVSSTLGFKYNDVEKQNQTRNIVP
jgi:hypothetical protein